MTPRRIVLTVEYEGTGFHGWQIQPGLRTVQGDIRHALSRMMGEKVSVVGSGRTDAGVHALAQVAHADVGRDIPCRNIMMGLNSSLEPDVRIIACRDAAPGFHARFSAVEKTYRYRIRNTEIPTAMERNRTWQIRQPLDVERMREAARCLVGKQDFFSFKSAGDPCTTVREMRRLDIIPRGKELILEFTADGFLKHMVRNITGALVQVGLGRMTPGQVHEILVSRTREDAPPKAPAKGLVLVEVCYGSGGA